MVDRLLLCLHRRLIREAPDFHDRVAARHAYFKVAGTFQGAPGFSRHPRARRFRLWLAQSVVHRLWRWTTRKARPDLNRRGCTR